MQTKELAEQPLHTCDDPEKRGWGLEKNILIVQTKELEEPILQTKDLAEQLLQRATPREKARLGLLEKNILIVKTKELKTLSCKQRT